MNEEKAVLMGWVDHKGRFQDASIELDVSPDRMHPKHLRPVPILIAYDLTFWQAAMHLTRWVQKEKDLRWVLRTKGYREQTIFASNKGNWQQAWDTMRDVLLHARKTSR